MPSMTEEMEENFSTQDEQGENLWVDILVDVQSSSRTKLPTSKSLLVLGDNETGKTTLIAKMQGVEEPKKGSGLEYMYMNIKDEYRDDQTRLGAWIVDGDLYHRGLLKFALTEQSFAHAVVLLVATLAKPWDIMDTLQRWVEVLATHVQRLKLPADARQKQQDTLLRQFQEYVEPEEGAAGSATQLRRVSANPLHQSVTDAVDNVLLPLGDNVFTENLGIPIVVVLTKSDSISALEKDQEYREEHWDFVQQHVRKFCLKYGAALVYCSVKENKNCVLLYKYLLHRIYGFPFTSPACVVEKDSVFIPSGWDSDKKVSILYDNMSSMRPDDHFNDVIVRPITRKPIQRDVEVSADEEQTFLLKLQAQLAKQPQASAASSSQRESPLRATGPGQNSTTKSVISPRVPGSTSVASAMTPPKKVEGPKMSNPTSSDTGVLANFFNSLLSKKTVSSASSAGTALSNDAAAELSRMTQARVAAAANSDSVNDSDAETSPSDANNVRQHEEEEDK